MRGPARFFILTLVACSFTTVEVVGQESPPAPVREIAAQRYERLVDQLDAPDWNDRETATHLLARDTQGVSTRLIEDSLEAGGLSLEQVNRLLRVMEIRLLYAPRGAIGIQMLLQQGINPGGVEVTAVIPGLPAEELIKVGDVITHIDGEQLNDRDDLARIVQSHWPGDPLQLRVLRTKRAIPDADGNRPAEPVVELLEIEIELGSTEQLRTNGRSNVLDPGRGQRSLKMRDLLQRHGAIPYSLSIPLTKGRGMSRIDQERDPIIQDVLRKLESNRAGISSTPMEQLRSEWALGVSMIDATLERKDISALQRARLEYRRGRLLEIIEETRQ